MKDRITIEGRDGAFGAYIARPKALPAPAVVVLHEVFGVNADIRKTCDELAEQGFIAHAFARHNGTHYNAAAAALANGRTSEFLHRQLGAPSAKAALLPS